ncbi:hypothetical protein A1O3_09883 [Capronia epimyces CBS 606.96]|uniref:Prion-inhibition and propagation HeLo domain-containing protein n=1 Tax=Capronia epimyces CBS 606.96 TaxID=1182542 RepID=W9Y5B7_9EURO|nr:uncharacterized protein A1O3_09883 [Capronia epimyces CBS 606.96]EXJ77654.1 hypothetical protein A1O3_09883 [Capronia epimyces CBS 606.96]
MDTISSKVGECLALYRRLLALPAESNRPGTPSKASRLIATREQFILWYSNIGAHQKGRGSLDYRLREASHLRDLVIEILDRLSRILAEG